MSRRIAIVSIALAIVGGVLAGSASAAEFTLRSCSMLGYEEELTGSANWWYEEGETLPKSSSNCPSGLGFDTSQPVQNGAISKWTLSTPAVPATESLSMKLRGGESVTGMSYKVENCSYDGCTTIYDVPPRSAAAPDIDIALPVNIYWLVVSATCSDPDGWCAPALPLHFNNVDMRIVDDTPPTLSHFYVSNLWQKRESVSPTIMALDHRGVGMAWVSAAIGNRVIWTNQHPCYFYYGQILRPYYGPSRICQAGISVGSAVGAFLRDLPDGEHAVTVYAQDGVQNQMTPVSKTIKIDDTVPETPTDGKASPVDQMGGWTPNDRVTISWANPPTPASIGQQSPVRYVARERQQLWPTAGERVASPDAYVSGNQTATQTSNLEVPSDGKWAFWVSLVDEAGNRSGKHKIEVWRDATTPSKPQLKPNPWISRDDFQHGFAQEIQNQPLTGLESGICGYAVTVNPTAESLPPETVTHAGSGGPLSINGAPNVYNHVHVRARSCAGLWSADAAHTPLNIDPEAPAVELDPSPSAIWRREALNVEITATDVHSGPLSLKAGLNTLAPQILDSTSSTLQVPDGVHELAYEAEDAAGNTTGVKRATYKVDQAAPIASFEPHDPTSPTRVNASVSDPTSGVASAVVQMRAVGSGENGWRTVPTTTSGSVGDKLWSVAAEVQDASANGDHEFRVVSSDVAGNVSAAGLVRGTDQQLRLTLPLRKPVSLSASLVKRCGKVKKRRTCTASVVGVVASGGAGQRVSLEIAAAIGSAGPGAPSRIDSDSEGRFNFPITLGPNRTFTIAFPGDSTRLPATASVRHTQTASAVLKVNRKRARKGVVLRFSGRLTGDPSGSVAGKVPIVLEFKNGRSAQTGIGKAKTDQLGRFKVPGYALRNSVAKPYTLKVRAAVLADGTGWNYGDGYSNWVSIRIRP